MLCCTQHIVYDLPQLVHYIIVLLGVNRVQNPFLFSHNVSLNKSNCDRHASDTVGAAFPKLCERVLEMSGGASSHHDVKCVELSRNSLCIEQRWKLLETELQIGKLENAIREKTELQGL